MRTVCGRRCVSAAPRLVEPVDPEEIGHARQARPGAKQVACHRPDSIAAARRVAPAARRHGRASARTLCAHVCAGRDGARHAAHRRDGSARARPRRRERRWPSATALCLAAYLPLFADLGHGLGRRAALRGARARAHGSAGIRRSRRSWRRSRSGARLEPELVAALNGRTELLALAECTTVGRCESPEGPWLAQNWDWYADAPERCLVWSAAVEGARFATMTEAGILAKVGVSTRGIAVALNILYHARDGRGELGVPVHLVLRRLLDEAGERRGRLGAAARDAVLGLQLHHRRRRRRRRRVLRALARRASRASSRATACCAHTNHFLDETLARGEAEQPADWLPGSRARLATAERAAPRELADALALLADHDVRAPGDLPSRRAAGRARPASRRHGRLAGHAPGRARSCAWPPGSRAMRVPRRYAV